MQQENSFSKAIFFGNYFYGLCAITLSIETALQQGIPLNTAIYYIALFAATTLYYTKAYISINTANSSNKRSVWYVTNKKLVIVSQVVLIIILLISSILLLRYMLPNILQITLPEWVMILCVPIVAAGYYGINLPNIKRKNLRSFGWLKPFLIGFVWAGVVSIYPIIYYHIMSKIVYHITWFGCLLFIKNFMFVTVLCIMFDIKDYATDHNQQLKTFVVKIGLRRTIFLIIIPLSCVGLFTFELYAITHHFSVLRIIINTIPFVLLLLVAYSLHRRKSILYYLAVIDGLLLVKSICGITATLYF
ncbi:MAG: hypothetical protein H7101_10200 [Deinococcales bacterium]|nr:hypothetical protein [Chitinophagaceae bacterium]